ncbi:unnamed protein product [Phytomonas sp. EM1]|nr:unnamed protein product [Phytomonas sp. EM1]|eukprot:CCW63263.1 unnamed protein product [Phytomonas sp. isolate EM1]
MADTAYDQQLQQAQKTFDEGKFSDAESILQGMSPDDLKIYCNLVMVQYLQGELDIEQAIAKLAPPSDSSDVATNSNNRKNGAAKARNITLLYEGHETAFYNRAVLYARAGLILEAAAILRSILAMSKYISLKVLTYSLCLLHTVTRPAPKLGGSSRSKEDEDLIQSVLNERMEDITKDAELLALVTAAFADSSSVHEAFKNSNNNPMEQSIYLNNLGVFLMGDGKIGTAALCFSKAMETSGQQPSSQFIQQPVAYNAALCALLNEDYEEAIKHLLSVQAVMRISPLFWVRFAEAAIGLVQRHFRARQREEYERQQSAFSALLQTGKVYANFEFMLLPGAATVTGPMQEPLKDSPAYTAAEQQAAVAIRNALFLLIPKGHSLSSALDAFPEMAQVLQHASLYWVALELFRKNYQATNEVGEQLLNTHEKHPLPTTVHATLLSYMVEALIHLNDPSCALKVLRRASLSSLINNPATESVDVAQRSRLEVLFINLAVTHVLTGSWNQAHVIMDSVLAKLYEAAPSASNEYRPEREALFAYQMLAIFLDLAQGNQEKAAEWLTKLNWPY